MAVAVEVGNSAIPGVDGHAVTVIVEDDRREAIEVEDRSGLPSQKMESASRAWPLLNLRNSLNANCAVSRSFCSARPSAKRYCSSGLTTGNTSGCAGTSGAPIAFVPWRQQPHNLSLPLLLPWTHLHKIQGHVCAASSQMSGWLNQMTHH